MVDERAHRANASNEWKHERMNEWETENKNGHVTKNARGAEEAARTQTRVN